MFKKCVLLVAKNTNLYNGTAKKKLQNSFNLKKKLSLINLD